ncbi:MAG: transcriptional regulator [Bacteroidia bacterium]|nr:transcriptional regulator [Bacteroidia bacterium]
MKEASIVKAAIPQADGKVKLRPALLLRKLHKFDDFLLCGISSKTEHYIDGFDEIIDENDSDFKESGLLQTSLIRLGFLAALPQNSILGSIGVISSERHKRLLHNLSNYLLKEK